jgi:hypothetical protein
MDTVIGLGKAGCAIADKFSQYPQYKIFKIDIENIAENKKNEKLLKKKTSPEQYEASVPSMRTFLKPSTDDVLFVLSGSGAISGTSLRILEQLSKMKKTINVLYIKPDVEFLGANNKAQERLVRNVLQEYARSGKLERLYLVDNKLVESVIGEVPVFGYYDRLNDLIASTLHMVNLYNHQSPVHSTSFEPSEITRVSTLGVIDTESGEEKLFFLLDNASEKCYYYAINQKTLETDGTLMKKIINNINNNTKEEEGIKTAFRIHSTSYEQDYAYIVANTARTGN